MYLLDSNILIGYLNGSKKEVDFITDAKKSNELLSFSVISRIETLSLNGLKEEDVKDIESFLDIFTESFLSNDIVLLSARLRRGMKLSLGDAVILATAILQNKKAKSLVEVLLL